MNGKRILAFGAHPDDIEFGCGAVLLDAVKQGAQIKLVVLSKGEAGTHGDSNARETEAQAAANMLGAELQFLPTEGDTRIRANLELSQSVAAVIRKSRPDIVLAPSWHPNQHPDHRETSKIVRDAHRLARYGKTPGLEDHPPHAVQLLFFYDISTAANGADSNHSILIDISSQVERWKTLMQCHASQVKNMDYVDLQLSRARVYGIQMGVHSAVRLLMEGPPMAGSLAELGNFKSQRF
ncbi:MAG: PIG-L family deacetylase [Verrucomicrobiae bacterium]|nr:PIG-L family deacetylase [Verrucomicrobiae bacterium]